MQRTQEQAPACLSALLLRIFDDVLMNLQVRFAAYNIV